MKLIAKDVRESGPLSLEEVVPAAEMPLDPSGRPSLSKPLKISLQAEAFEGLVLAKVRGETAARLECARCSDSFERGFLVKLELQLPLAVEQADVTDEVRQSVILALPVRPLCRPECRGLCGICGQNFNLGKCSCVPESGESPFSALKNLKLK